MLALPTKWNSITKCNKLYMEMVGVSKFFLILVTAYSILTFEKGLTVYGKTTLGTPMTFDDNSKDSWGLNMKLLKRGIKNVGRKIPLK